MMWNSLLLTSPVGLFVLFFVYTRQDTVMSIVQNYGTQDTMERVTTLLAQVSHDGGVKLVELWTQWRFFGSWWIMAICLGYLPVHMLLTAVALS
jgi:hypothetical protein